MRYHFTIVLHRQTSRTAQGETVPYVICVEVAEDGTRADGGGSKGLAERAYHVDEVRGNARLAIDTEYYLAHQVPAPRCRFSRANVNSVDQVCNKARWPTTPSATWRTRCRPRSAFFQLTSTIPHPMLAVFCLTKQMLR